MSRSRGEKSLLRHWLHHLRHEHAELALDVAERRRSFWIGSGISREQAPDLVALIRHTLEFLRDSAFSGRADAADHDDALRRILRDHVAVELPEYEAAGEAWEPGDLESTRNSYSQILGTWVDNKPGNYLLMDGANVPSRYGDAEIEPGADHLLLAILIAEGVLSELASGNWDGLIEKAVLRYTGDPNRLSVHVVADDIRDGGSAAWRAKFHGCAVKALSDPGTYGPAIVATTGQISVWSTLQEFAHMRTPLVQNVQQFRSLILGLSVQDADLLDIFTLAAGTHPWPWEPEHPAYVFAERQISASQETVLANSYSEYSAHRPEILARSAFGDFSRPILAALVVFVVVEKMKAALRRTSGLPPAMLDEAASGLDTLESFIADVVRSDYSRLVDLLDHNFSPFVRQFFGASHYRAGASYTPLVDGPLSRVSSDPTVTMIGANWLALALGLFGRGAALGHWRLRLREHDGHVFLEVRRPFATPVLIAVVADAEAADAILQLPAWMSGPVDMAIVHTGSQRPNPSRSSMGRIGSARGDNAKREVWLSDVLADAQGADGALANLFAGGAA